MDTDTLLRNLLTIPRAEAEKYIHNTYHGRMLTYNWLDKPTDKERATTPIGLRPAPLVPRSVTGMCNNICFWDGNVIAHIRDRRIETELEDFIQNTIIHGHSQSGGE